MYKVFTTFKRLQGKCYENKQSIRLLLDCRICFDFAFKSMEIKEEAKNISFNKTTQTTSSSKALF